MRKKLRNVLLVLFAVILVGGVIEAPVYAASKTPTCSSLYKAAKKKVSSGAKKVTKKSKCTFLTSTYRKYVKDFYYASDSDGVYCVCIVRADTTSHAKKIKTQFSSTLKSMKNSTYYYNSSTDQKVIKSTQIGRSGKYVWYISLATTSKANKNAVTALKKKL